MDKLILGYHLNTDEIRNFRNEFVLNNEHMHGGAGLAENANIEEWKYLIENCEIGYSEVPSSTFFYVDEMGYPIGIIDIRHSLNESLLQNGGHIGYSVRKSMRGQGHAKAMLEKALELCRENNMERVLITCKVTNPASMRVIMSKGGVLEDIRVVAGVEWMRFWVEL